MKKKGSFSDFPPGMTWSFSPWPLRGIMEVIQHFCSRSGQCINHRKSLILLSRRMKEARRLAIAEIFSGREMGRYLGIALVTSRLGPRYFMDL